MPTDARSTHEDLPVPHIDNDVNEDMPRVGDAIEAIGTKIHDVRQTLAGKAATAHTHEIAAIDGLQAALDTLSAAVSGLSTPGLNDLDDVDVGSATNGMVLLYVGSAWQAAKIAAANVTVGASSDVEAELTALGNAIATLAEAVSQKADSSALGALAAKNQVGTGDFDVPAALAELGIGFSTRINSNWPQYYSGSQWLDFSAKPSALGLVGAVVPFAMSNPPSGWLECDGSEISRTVYSELFLAIGTVFGAGDGSSTFNLPDLRGEFVRGWDNGKGTDSGRAFGTFQDDAFQNFTGETRLFSSIGVDGGSTSGAFTTGASNLGNRASGENGVSRTLIIDPSVVARTADETRPRNITLMFCIRF
ncbi:MAG: phage tail protein [Pseudomonadota bacterium]